MKEFEKILDDAEKEMGDPKLTFAFVLVGLEHNPHMNLQRLLDLKKIFDSNHNSHSLRVPLNSSIPTISGKSRTERRAMERMNKVKSGSTKKKKNKKRK